MATGIEAIVERAAAEGKPVVVEGVHVVPGRRSPALRERCVLVEALVVVDDPDLHRGHFSLPPGLAARPSATWPHFEEIRAAAGPPLASGARAESVADRSTTPAWTTTLARLMELVLDAVQRGPADRPAAAPAR